MKTSLNILAGGGVVCLFVCVAVAQTEFISTYQAAERFAEATNLGVFPTVIKNVAKTMSPFLSIFSSVVKLIFGIRSGSTQSAELKYLHQLCDNINLKFDQVNSQFLDVKHLIQWTATQNSYATFEANIHVVSEQFRNIFEVPTSGMDIQKQLFTKSYESGYIHTQDGSKLFAGFIEDSGIIGKGLLRPAMENTENNRGQMRIFMIGILKLLVMAAKVELGYYVIKSYEQVIPFYIHVWQVRFEKVQKRMSEIDLELKNTYLIQALKDIDKFSMDNLRLSNEMFSRNLYLALSTKYFWRDWLVVVSTHTEGQNDAHSHVCNGVIKSTHRTKDLVIDSVEKTKPSFDTNEVHGLFESLNTTCKNTANYIPCEPQRLCSYPYSINGCMTLSNHCYQYYTGVPCRRIEPCGSYKNSKNAETIFNWITDVHVRNSCSTYSSVGIIATDKNPVYNAGPTEGNSSRLFVNDLGICKYKVHFFG